MIRHFTSSCANPSRSPFSLARHPRALTSLACALGVTVSMALFAACSASSGSSDSESFKVHATSYAVNGATKVVISGFEIAYLADESTTGSTGGGTFLNADADKNDTVAVYVNASSKTELNTGVAAQDLAWIGSELYLVVSEAADDKDWNLDADKTDTVLVHWSSTSPTPVFVDVLNTTGTTRMVAFGSQLLYASASVPVGANTSNLKVISSGAPLVTTAVATTDAGGPLNPTIVAQEEGLVFLSLNENVEARNLNGGGVTNDTDATDANVLALFDLRNPGGVVRSVGLAFPGISAPFRAKYVSGADWQVGFLVSEAAQGNTNLNNPALFAANWLPTQCTGLQDTDTNDDILHYLFFANWVIDPVANPVRNTGIVGSQKIAIANGYIATITPESSAGGTLGEGTCDLNSDGDKNDKVVRWTQLVTGTSAILPFNSAANIHALFDVPGGTHGLAELQNRFVIVTSEQQDNLDINGDTLKTFNLVGWLLPSTTVVPWQYAHSGNFVGASWVAEERTRSRLNVALEEKVGGVSINTGTPSAPGDNDILDSIPTFAVFSTATTLTFPGVKIAVEPGNPGIADVRGLGYYRVGEAADNRDWTGDGDKNDQVVFRSSFTSGLSSINGVSNTLNRPVIEFNAEEATPACVAILSDETKQGAAGSDINNDGDRTDIVLQYFIF